MNLLGLIHLNCQAGIPVEQPWVAELQRRLRDTPFAPGDRTVLYSLKEMTIAGSLCLGRPDVDSLFAAAIANPGVSPGVRAMLHSWHADYLWLHEKDLPAAFAALGQSLTLVPSNPSNRLKLAQLRFIAGERDQARQLLLELRGERLSWKSERRLTNCWQALVCLKANLPRNRPINDSIQTPLHRYPRQKRGCRPAPAIARACRACAGCRDTCGGRWFDG